MSVAYTSDAPTVLQGLDDWRLISPAVTLAPQVTQDDPPRTLVLDMSRYQMAPESTTPPNFGAMYAAGVRGVIFRAIVTGTASGICGKDVRLDFFVACLLEYNAANPDEQIILVGYYGAIRLERSIVMQIDAMNEALLPHPPARTVADIEGAPPYGLTPYQATSLLAGWLYDTAGTGNTIYSTALWMDNYLEPYDWDGVADLWIARYPRLIAWNKPALLGPWSDGNYIPRDFATHALWQYGTPAVGAMLGVESAEIDCNLFPGTVAQLAAWAQGTPLPDPLFVTVPAGLNIRDSVWGRDWGNTQGPVRLPVLAEETDSAGRVWYKLPAWVAGWLVQRG